MSFYSERDEREDLHDPLFRTSNRRRAGVRESEKFNLEYNQFMQAILELFDYRDTFAGSYVNLVEGLRDGGEVIGVTDEESESLVIEGYEELVARAQRIQARLKVLGAYPGSFS